MEALGENCNYDVVGRVIEQEINYMAVLVVFRSKKTRNFGVAWHGSSKKGKVNLIGAELQN